MSINFSGEEKEHLVRKLREYCSRELDQELGQFDAEFLLDFISENFGAVYYNRGLQDAQVIVADRVDSLSDAISELEQVIDE